MNLETLNHCSAQEATEAFMLCCVSERWCQRMVEARPYADFAALCDAADQHWQGLGDNDYLQAFEGHPMIGDVSTLRAKYANTEALASGEQSSVNQATEQVIETLARDNQRYYERNGFIFIVCATGKSAEQMLALLQARLPNSRATEITNAAEEQRKITRIRLEKLL
ncbi:2-oxo-4-hydroxy-4-carboxy-5-ureidoimidazoline decarboxylase [Sinobacterium caligoides]|uniref:2-oxo-4-hydroxy-4-carboxy-5-ureidoimidazoline decarboxylase n=1 Tax=Sinobacterium caligoides TaxID=933926 RepID=A0A3N2E1T9_9GAMM|nr:2-oxo-4-hydroxy-4-carboxy-5-ureidoimidazoline decarboxylase [Sinobacterium caligoides]ROS05639.1 2-oxo-4-hydroxy-4-carboxy-5-ureidoimidazoline decarboxylase [Sinobacterium caligoides]